MEEQQMKTIRLDDFYAVRLWPEGQNEISGEIIMVAAEPGQGNTRLFNLPLMQNEQAAKDWAFRALQAYREG
ncbi:MAG: hypothetical protein K0S39_4430 [Paenibacillus sp.]|nr:hypothetical protein [Paenibacillus sp.]